MDREQLIQELKVLVAGYIESRGLEFVDLICRYEGRELVLRVLADRPEGGISLQECAQLNRGIGGILDEKEILKEGYLLEVSSSGLDRPLSTKRDFLRCINKKARFFLNEPINERIELEGAIIRVDRETVCVDTGKEVIEIPLPKINRAKQAI